MDTPNNLRLVADICNEHYQAMGNPCGVPLEYFEKKGLGRYEIRLALSTLQQKGVIKGYKRCWGFFEFENGSGKAQFTFTNSIKPPKDDEEKDFKLEAFLLDVVPSVLKDFLKDSPQGKPHTIEENKEEKEGFTFLLSAEGKLYSRLNARHSYSMKRGGGRFEILEYLIDSTLSYVPTDDIARALQKKPEAIRHEINKLSKAVIKPLKLGKLPFIENVRHVGYRLNPRIEIIKDY